MTALQLDTEKKELLKQVKPLVALKKKLYSNMDIESAMSVEEKELTTKIAAIFSRINQIAREKRNTK